MRLKAASNDVYYVASFWWSTTGQARGNRPIVHVYGPFTLAEARKAKREAEKEPVAKEVEGIFFATVCKPIDVKLMNEQNKEQGWH
jgi:hypothetical protein